MVKARLLLVSALFMAIAGLTAFLPTGTAAAACDQSSPAGCTNKEACSKDNFGFFGLEPWYQYLPYNYNGATHRCEIASSASENSVLSNKSFILLIVLAVIDDLLRVAGMVAIIFIIVGGFKFITAQGEPEAAASGRKTILFALVGLVVALIAVVIVSFIGNAIGT